MRSQFGGVLKWACALLAAVCIPAVGGLVGAAGPSFADTPPAIAFVDDQDLALDFERLKENSGQLPVTVRNKRTDMPVTVAVEFVGPDPLTVPKGSELDKFLPQRPPVETIDPSTDPSNRTGDKTFTLNFNHQNRPKDGTYVGQIVASGGGDVIRRRVTLTVAPTPTPSPTGTAQAVILPKRLEALSLAGTNYVPSPLNPFLPAVVTLGGAGLVWWGARSLLERQDRAANPSPGGLSGALGIPWWVLGGCALFLGGAMYVLNSWVTSEGWLWGPRFIIVNEARVAASVPKGMVGTVASGDGGLGAIVYRGDWIKIEDIPRAGTYVGKMDLGGEIKTTVNVADWWLYALAAITAGVLAGQWLTRYFSEGRPAQEQRTRRAKILDRIKKDDDAFVQTHGHIFDRFTLLPLAATDWIPESTTEEDLSHGRVSVVKDRLDRLETYERLHRQYREDATALHRDIESLWTLVQALKLGVARQNVDALNQAAALLQKERLSFPQEDEQGSRLKERHEAVRAAAAWIAVATGALKDIEAYLKDAEERLKDAEERFEVVVFVARQRNGVDAQGAPRVETPRQDTEADPQVQNEDLRKAEADRNSLRVMGCQLLVIGRQIAMANKKDVISAKLEAADTVWRQMTGLEPLPDDADPPGFNQIFLGITSIDGVGRGLGWEQIASRAMYLRLDDGGSPQGETRGYEELRKRLIVTERQMGVIAGALAVASGLVAVYFTTPGWGSPADYLKAFLWGSVLSEGTKYVSSLVARAWPTK